MRFSRLAALALATAALSNAALAADANDGLYPTGMPGAGRFDVLGVLGGTRINRDANLPAINLNYTDKVHSNGLDVSGRYGLNAKWALLVGMQAVDVNTTSHAANGASQHSHVEGLSGAVLGLTRDLLPRDGRAQALTADLTVRRFPQRRSAEVTLQYGLGLTGSIRLDDDVHPYAHVDLNLPNEGTGQRQSNAKVGAWFRLDDDVSVRASVAVQRSHANDTMQGMSVQVLEVGSVVTVDARTRVLPTLSVARLMRSGTRDGNVVVTGGHGMTLSLGLYHAY